MVRSSHLSGSRLATSNTTSNNNLQSKKEDVVTKSNVRRNSYRLDRHGIPILDPPHEANKLPKRCAPGQHYFVRASERFVGTSIDGSRDIYEVEYRCDKCRAKSVETRVE